MKENLKTVATSATLINLLLANDYSLSELFLVYPKFSDHKNTDNHGTSILEENSIIESFQDMIKRYSLWCTPR